MLTLIRFPFHPRVTAVARKRPRHSAKSAGGRLQLNTHTPLTQPSRSWLTMPLSRHSVGTYQETSSYATRQENTRPKSFQLVSSLWTDPDVKSGISVRELISTLKKCAGGKRMVEHSPQILAGEKKAFTTTTTTTTTTVFQSLLSEPLRN